MSAEVIKMSNQDKDRNVALESAIGYEELLGISRAHSSTMRCP